MNHSIRAAISEPLTIWQGASFDFMVTVGFPERLIGDKAYGFDKPDARLDAIGVDIIDPHRSNRKPENETQDSRDLRRYKRRWTVESTIGWLQNYGACASVGRNRPRCFKGL